MLEHLHRDDGIQAAVLQWDMFIQVAPQPLDTVADRAWETHKVGSNDARE